MDATAGERILVSLRHAKAMSLARHGRNKEAQAVLAGDRAIPEDTASLQLLAALVTDEGDYLRALRLWQQLLQRDPDHAEARRMVEAIELWLSRPSWMKYAPLGAATIAALVVAGLFWILASGPTPSTPGPISAPVATSPIQSRPVAPASSTYPGNVPPGTNAPIVGPTQQAVTSTPVAAPVVNFPGPTKAPTKTNRTR